MTHSLILAAAPQPSWAGIITAFASLVIAVGGGITSVSMALARRAASRRLDAYQRDTTNRLTVIHTLVNSTLTASMQAELDASKRELLIMREVASLRIDAGQPTTAEQASAIEALERKVGQLALAMHERRQQAVAADQQIAAEQQRAMEEAGGG